MVVSGLECLRSARLNSSVRLLALIIHFSKDLSLINHARLLCGGAGCRIPCPGYTIPAALTWHLGGGVTIVEQFQSRWSAGATWYQSRAAEQVIAAERGERGIHPQELEAWCGECAPAEFRR